MRRSLLLAPLLSPLAWALPLHAQPLLPPQLLGHGARLLGILIGTARETAIAAGVKPVPPLIQRALLGFFPAALLRKVRYASGNAGQISIPGLALSYGHIDAVTLGEVVLFRDERKALADRELWAHEITHVMQYERWGIEEFAARYLEDRETIEQEARDNAARYLTWSRQAGT